MSSDAAETSALAPLGREEYIEQAHFFKALAERLRENAPAQEVLASVREEVLATTKLPMAIDFLLAELRHAGAFGAAMSRLEHYFTPFQAFVVQEAENERGRFMRITEEAHGRRNTIIIPSTGLDDFMSAAGEVIQSAERVPANS